MYQIQLASIRDELYTPSTQEFPKSYLGGSQDSATAFAIAADADALATRLMDCADARLSIARGAVWGDNPDALFYNPPAALNQSARALALIEKACETKRFSEFMLGCAVIFERAGLGDTSLNDDDPNNQAAQAAWGALMSEGIFDREMYL